MSEEFTGLQDSFFSDNCGQFEASEENKLEYMTIFSQYVETIERYIESSLQDVNFQEFGEMIKKRPDEIDGPLFEMLTSFSDFEVFKEMMLSSKNDTNEFMLNGAMAKIHTEDCSDGEEMPDLNLCITKI